MFSILSGFAPSVFFEQLARELIASDLLFGSIFFLVLALVVIVAFSVVRDSIRLARRKKLFKLYYLIMPRQPFYKCEMPGGTISFAAGGNMLYGKTDREDSQIIANVNDFTVLPFTAADIRAMFAELDRKIEI